jgi:hypothetical protein
VVSLAWSDLWLCIALRWSRCTNYGVPHAGNRIIVSVSGEQFHEAGSYEVSRRKTYTQARARRERPTRSITGAQTERGAERAAAAAAVVLHTTIAQELTDETVDSGGYSTYDCMILAFCSHVRQVQVCPIANACAFFLVSKSWNWFCQDRLR